MKKEAELIVTSLNSQGAGEAVFNEKPVGIPFSLPGEKVLTFLNWGKKRGTLRGEILEVKESSPIRINPKCPHFSRCGGCLWQMASYEDQISFKQQTISSLFPTANPIIAADKAFSFRNKMEFSFSENKSGEQFLGLYMAGKKGKVENLKTCPISPDWFSDALKATRDFWKDSGLKAYFHPKDLGSLRTLTLRDAPTTGGRMAFLTVSGNPDFALSQSQIDLWKETMLKECGKESPLSLFILIQQIKKGEETKFYEIHLHGPETIEERLTFKNQEVEKEFSFQISPLSFFQPNTYQARVIYQKALDLCGDLSGKVVLDLYCGTGTLASLFSLKAKKVIGVELSHESVCDGRENLKNNGIKNVELIRGDASKVLEELEEKGDLMLLDPPRSGITPKGISTILEHGPKEILYISCNPKTQAIDIKELVENGYSISTVQPIDQFPQSPHMENLVFLQK